MIGLGQLGEAAALQLQESGHDVIVADIDMERVEAIKENVQGWCLMPPMNMCLQPLVLTIVLTLLSLGEAHLEAAVVAAMALLEVGVEYDLSCSDHLQGKILSRVGVHRVIGGAPAWRCKTVIDPSLTDVVA